VGTLAFEGIKRDECLKRTYFTPLYYDDFFFDALHEPCFSGIYQGVWFFWVNEVEAIFFSCYFFWAKVFFLFLRIFYMIYPTTFFTFYITTRIVYI
jgi:hypothetical protein